MKYMYMYNVHTLCRLYDALVWLAAVPTCVRGLLLVVCTDQVKFLSGERGGDGAFKAALVANK